MWYDVREGNYADAFEHEKDECLDWMAQAPNLLNQTGICAQKPEKVTQPKISYSS